MTYNYPTIIVDNFFKYPNDVRELALLQDFFPCPQSSYSGVRTRPLHTHHPEFFRSVCSKIIDSYSIRCTNFAANMFFHWTGEEVKSGGWVHRDRSRGVNGTDMCLASIIYLNESNNSIDTGTSLYKLNNISNWDKKTNLMVESNRNTAVKKENIILHNQDYTPTVKISNLFNRMISYDAAMPHSGMNYFGSDKNTGRLTLLTFFSKINSEDNYTPLQRAQHFSDI